MTIHTETVSYSANGDTLVGYLAHDPDAPGEKPGILVVHEWWGLNDYIRQRAEQVAALGYTALAVDMYGNGRLAKTPDEAGELMNQVLDNMDVGTARLRAALDTLQAHPTVDNQRIGAIGYCFGGGAVLHMARLGLPLRAVVSFHGSLGSMYDAEPGSIKATILVCHGSDDAMITEEDVGSFREEMDAAEANYTIIAYEGAQHGFTSPEATINGEKYGLPLSYNETADHASWDAMRSLFTKVF